MKYEVIYSNSLKGLVDTVNKYLVEGWKTSGGVSSQLLLEKKETDITPSPVLYFYQAITKDSLVIEGNAI